MSHVAIIKTDSDLLVIRSSPTVEEVQGFVKEHNRRYLAGEPGGPSEIAAYKIKSAYFLDNELDLNNSKAKKTKIDITDALS